MDEVHEFYEFILPLVLEAGKVMTNVENAEGEIKNDVWWDLVTIYDKKIEEVLIHKIKEKYPSHKHIGEEEMEKLDKIPDLTSHPTWIIDPIDGTHNFVRHMPITCISVGLTIDKIQVMGVVYNPYMKELFTAIKGEGAYLNGKKIQTSGCKGCGVLGLCYVACGRTDAYQLDGVYPWDAAAGTLILKEAGGYVTDSSGKEFDLMNPNFLGAATKELSDQYMEIERRADEENDSFAKQKEELKP